jgi:hypothetical protein
LVGSEALTKRNSPYGFVLLLWVFIDILIRTTPDFKVYVKELLSFSALLWTGDHFAPTLTTSFKEIPSVEMPNEANLTVWPIE